MIIGSKEVYFRYDPSENLFGVIPKEFKCCYNPNLQPIYMSRDASEDLTWINQGFTDFIINKSIEPKTTESNPKLTRSTNQVCDNLVRQSHSLSRSAPQEIVTELTEPVSTTSPETTQQSFDNDIWKLINKIAWVDKDEIVRTQQYIDQKIFIKEQRRDLYRGMLRFAEPLADKFLNLDVYEALNEEEKNNFLFHVIGKGSVFYNFSLSSPDIALYLFNGQIQNLYSFLKELI